jgi:hypothetical protein
MQPQVLNYQVSHNKRQVTREKAETCGSKLKRKKTSVINYQNMFENVQQAVANISTPPPLIHTPHSMFSMLCDTFEKEFPDCLPQRMRDQSTINAFPF